MEMENKNHRNSRKDEYDQIEKLKLVVLVLDVVLSFGGLGYYTTRR